MLLHKQSPLLRISSRSSESESHRQKVLTVSYGPERPENSKKGLEINNFIVRNETHSIIALQKKKGERQKDRKEENAISAEMYVLYTTNAFRVLLA